jgi:LmbE family N-acetylglucosaminyl deacetylase
MIGCGGWLILTSEAAVRRTIVYCTRVEPLRRAEAQAALMGLAPAAVIELNLPERDRAPSALYQAQGRLHEILQETRPTYVFVPPLQDPHPDHHNAHLLLSAALQAGEKEALPTVLQYEGLVALPASNWMLNISKVEAEKRRRLAAYASQDRRYGLATVVGHLNAYRGGSLLRRSVSHAEAYFRMSGREYLKCLPDCAC